MAVVNHLLSGRWSFDHGAIAWWFVSHSEVAQSYYTDANEMDVTRGGSASNIGSRGGARQHVISRRSRSSGDPDPPASADSGEACEPLRDRSRRASVEE